VARQRNAGSSSSLTRNMRHHKRFSKGDAAGERAAMFHDTAVRVYRMAQCNVTAAERPYPRQSQRNADREAGRDGVLSAALVTAKLITVQLLNVSRSECLSWCQAGR
jgi:hypothetical protein